MSIGAAQQYDTRAVPQLEGDVDPVDAVGNVLAGPPAVDSGRQRRAVVCWRPESRGEPDSSERPWLPGSSWWRPVSARAAAQWIGYHDLGPSTRPFEFPVFAIPLQQAIKELVTQVMAAQHLLLAAFCISWWTNKPLFVRSLYSLFNVYSTCPCETPIPRWSAATLSTVCASSRITAS